MEKTFICSICGMEHPASLRTYFNNNEFCVRCVETEFTHCSHCGQRIWRADNSGTRDTPLCDNCFTHHYTFCHRCGLLLRNNDAYYDNDDEDASYCYNCYNSDTRPRAIRDYYFKPSPIFYGSGPRYFGVELEVDGAGEINTNAQKVLDIANRTQTVMYCKHDGSLDDGFELVSHPMSLDYHCSEMPWAEIMDCLKSMGYTSHRAGTCGLHCHVSRAAFGNTESEQDAAIARVLFFVEQHWAELLKFSRRTQRQLERWATRYGYKDKPIEILDYAKKGYGAGRYTCVNLTNDDTIEFRIFRGTLKLNTFIATLQLIDRICDVAIFMSDDELKDMSWSTFVSGCTQPELIQYLKERRLYVNDPVETEGEI